MASIVKDAALGFAGRKLPIFPVAPNKKPLTAHGFKDASTDPAQIEAWWEQYPEAMIGMPTGTITDLHVIDIDVHTHDGFEAFRKLDMSLDDAPTVLTPSGGNHFYHRLGGRSLRNSAGRLGLGIDTRGNGGYIILPPSRPDLKRPPYQFINRIDLLAAPLLPPEIVKLLSATGQRSPREQLDDECARVASAPEGTRNDVLNRAAFRLAKLVRKGGLSEHAVRGELTAAALSSGLGVREIESTIDSAFDAAKREAKGARADDDDDDKKQGRPLKLFEPVPWEEEINGAELLDALVNDVKTYLVVTDEQAIAMALWGVHSHVYELSMITPRLAFTSPVSGCGKTTALDWLGRVVTRRLDASNISTSATFRAIELARPSLLIDEADTFLAANDELRGVLNSGHRQGGTVIRVVGDDHTPRQFSTHCPVAIACIGRLPTTLRNRSVEISLRRRLPGEKIESLELGTEDECELARKIARWARDNKNVLAHIRPKLPEQLVNRIGDNWKPLIAIAELAGGNWPEKVRLAALKLSDLEGDSKSLGLQLLADIRDAFAKMNADEDGIAKDLSLADLKVMKAESKVHTFQLPTRNLIAELVLNEERPWPDFKHGRMLSARQLAALLKPWGIMSHDIHPDGDPTPVKGYRLKDFRDSFDRYLPPFKAVPDTESDEETGS